MITAKTLKNLLKEIPDDALVHVYEGESIGISIYNEDKNWWIEAGNNEIDTYTEGFKNSPKEIKLDNYLKEELL